MHILLIKIQSNCSKTTRSFARTSVYLSFGCFAELMGILDCEFVLCRLSCASNTSYFKTLATDQLDAQIFNTFITILYMYMFRAMSCSSSGGQIVLIQHLVSSLSVSDRPVPDGHLLRVKIPDAVLIQFDLLRMSKTLLETCTCRGL